MIKPAEIREYRFTTAPFSQLTAHTTVSVSDGIEEILEYRYAIDESSGIAIADENGEIKHANAHFCQLSKYSQQELILNNHQIVNSSYHTKEYVRQLWDTLRKGGVWKGNIRNKAKDGADYWVSATIVPLFTENGKPRQYIAITIDISEQKRAEEKFALLASIVNSTDDAVISTDKDTLITSWNGGAETMFGYDAADVLGKSVLMLIKPGRLEEESAIIKRIAHGEYVEHHETEWISKDGRTLFISLNASPIKDADGLVIGNAKIIRNISERKESQRIKTELVAMVKKKAEELAGIFERITDGFIVLDKGFCFTYVNTQFGKMIGRDPASLLGKCFWDELPAMLRSRTHLSFEKAMKQQQFVSNIDYYQPLNLWQENHIYPGPEGLSIFIRNITKQKKAELQTQKSERIYKTIASSIPGSVICILDTDYRFQLVAGDMVEKLGYKKQKLLTRKASNVLTAECNAHLITDLRRVFQGETFTIENQCAEYDLITRYVPLKDEKKNIYAAMVVSIDVTKLKNAQRHIGQLNINLEYKVAERTEQLAIVNKELEAFTYSVSHDLRAPLRGIIGFTSMLEEDYTDKLDSEAKRITSIIKKNTSKMGMLIDDLLSFSRMSHQDIFKTFIDMYAMVMDVIEELDPLPVPGVVWQVHPLSPVKGDINIIRQVWVNLISNAIKYSAAASPARIEISSFIKDGQIIYSVKDNGVGFDNKYKDKLFKVFQRLHSTDQFEGTGVGLALVSKIISRHGGKVWAEGELGAGACFYFSLPVN